jgi:hypothetical protein
MSLSKPHAILIGTMLGVSLTLGCLGPEQIPDKQPITFEQLYSAPEKYHEKTILIEGFIFLGFETMVLSEELRDSGYAKGHLIPGERILWFEGGLPAEIYDQLFEQNMMGFSENYGKLRVEGVFQYGGEYGHLGMYQYQITPSEIELLTWSPN